MSAAFWAGLALDKPAMSLALWLSGLSMRESTDAQSLFDGLDVRGIVGLGEEIEQSGQFFGAAHLAEAPGGGGTDLRVGIFCGGEQCGDTGHHAPARDKFDTKEPIGFVGGIEESSNGRVGFRSGDGREAFRGG